MNYNSSNILRVFTSFSGYDSQLMALDRLKHDFPDFDYELVGWSEIDKYAIQAHDAIYPQYADRNYGDITTIDWAQVPDFDLFTYSSPCQDFSQAGLQRGGEQGSGTRSSLLWECERAIAAKKPKYLLMENVSALVSKKFIKLFNRWQVVLQGYGYKSFPQVLNAKDYGVPQNRERIFLVSILDEEARYEFPKKEKLTRRLKDVLDTEVDEKYYLNDEKVQGLLLSTQKEKDAGRGFAFEPKAGDDTANTVTGNAGSRKTDNFIQVVGDLQPDNHRPISGAARQQNYVIGVDGGSMAITAEHARHPFKIAEPTVLGWTRSNTGKGDPTYHPVSVANCVTAGKRDNTQNYVQEPAKCNVVAMLPDERLHDSARRIYDTDGLAHTQNTCGGGNHEPKIIDDTYKSRKPREYTENAPAIRSEREGFKVVEQEIVIGSMQSNAYRGTTDGPSPSITAACGMGGGQTPMVSVHPLSHKAEFRGFDDEKSPALRATDYKAPVCATDGFRIRKLTPRECFRLMDVGESDIDKIQAAGISNSQQYKLAGNSIVVACLYHIFRKAFIETENENQQLKLF